MSDILNNNPFPSDRIVVGALCYALRGAGDAREVLLLRRARPPHLGLWSPPGGKLELGESPDDAVRREMREETGLQLGGVTLRGVLTVYDRAFPIHWLLFVYRAEALSEGIAGQTQEGELRWIALSALDGYPRPHADVRHFPRVLADGGIFRASYVYDTPHTLVSAHVEAE